MKYLVTNFAYGYGPFLRTIELALLVNEGLSRKGQVPLGIIVPWVYGETQAKIMRENFAGKGDEIFLDQKLGEILRRVFYEDSSYEDALRAWVTHYSEVSRAAHDHLTGHEIVLDTLRREKMTISGEDIVLEIARAPRVSYDIAPSYEVTFGHISQILEETLHVDTQHISVDRDLVRRAIPIAKEIEKKQIFIGLAEPGTLFDKPNRPSLPNAVPIPPTIPTPQKNTEYFNKGIYITITGIPGLERLYKEAQDMGLVVYSNNPQRLPGTIAALPNIVSNEAIIFHFARGGWGSIWGTQLAGKGILLPSFDPADDPEIYFNNRCVEALGIGMIYTGQHLPEIIERMRALSPGIEKLNRTILEKFSTLDGSAYSAEHIVESYLKLQ